MTTFTNPDTIHRPSNGAIAPSAWGDTVNDDLNNLNGRTTALETGSSETVTSYNPTNEHTYTTTSSSWVALDTTNLTFSAVAPASGKVLVRLTAPANTNGAAMIWGALTHGTTTPAAYALAADANTNGIWCASPAFVISGLTAGQSYQWDWGAQMLAAYTGQVLVGGAYGPAVMEVIPL